MAHMRMNVFKRVTFVLKHQVKKNQHDNNYSILRKKNLDIIHFYIFMYISYVFSYNYYILLFFIIIAVAKFLLFSHMSS